MQRYSYRAAPREGGFAKLVPPHHGFLAGPLSPDAFSRDTAGLCPGARLSDGSKEGHHQRTGSRTADAPHVAVDG